MALKERIIRIDLSDLDGILHREGYLEPGESLNDAHIEPNELVLRALKEVL